jgi:hypothetical protein
MLEALFPHSCGVLDPCPDNAHAASADQAGPRRFHRASGTLITEVLIAARALLGVAAVRDPSGSAAGQREHVASDKTIVEPELPPIGARLRRATGVPVRAAGAA